MLKLGLNWQGIFFKLLVYIEDFIYSTREQRSNLSSLVNSFGNTILYLQGQRVKQFWQSKCLIKHVSFFVKHISTLHFKYIQLVCSAIEATKSSCITYIGWSWEYATLLYLHYGYCDSRRWNTWWIWDQRTYYFEPVDFHDKS